MTNAQLGRLLDRVLEAAWVHTFGASASPRLAGAKVDLLGSAATTLRAELRKAQPEEEAAARTLSDEEFVYLAMMGRTVDGSLVLGEHAADKMLQSLQRLGWQPPRAPERSGDCGVVGYPQGEKKVCKRAAGHEQDGVDYHRDGSVQWIGSYSPTISELRGTDPADEQHLRFHADAIAALQPNAFYTCRNCGARLASPTAAPASRCYKCDAFEWIADPPPQVGAVARSADSQAEPSTRVGTGDDQKDRPSWWTFVQASAYDAVLHRFCHLESLGALSREEAAIGAALALSQQVRELLKEKQERLMMRSHLREHGDQP